MIVVNLVCYTKKNPARPVVSLPLATKFNETVSMDLKKYKDFYFLVLVDMATRYTQACVLKNKQPQSLVRGVVNPFSASPIFSQIQKFFF